MANVLEILIKATDQASKVLKDVDKNLEKLGPSSQTTSGKLKAAFGSINDQAGKSLTSMLTLAGGVTAVGSAVYATAKFISGSISDWTAYNEEVRKLSLATGVGTEDLSRMMQAADDLGISMDAMKTSLIYASKNGVKPTIDNIAILSERLKGMKSDTQRNEEMARIFGKQWSEVAGFVLQGRDAILENTTAIDDALVVTQDSADAARELAAAQDNLNDSTTILKNTIAQGLTPALTDVTTWINGAATNIFTFDQRVDSFNRMTASDWIGYLFKGQKVTELVAEATDKAVISEDALIRNYEQGLPAAQYYAAANKEVSGAVDGVAKASMSASDWTRKYTTELLYNKAAAGLDAEGALKLARALGIADESTVLMFQGLQTLTTYYDKNKDGVIDASEATKDYYRAIELLDSRIKGLQDKHVNIYIHTWGSVPGSGTGRPGTGGSGGGGNYQRAAGGPVNAGQMYMVGENAPEFFVPSSNGQIVTLEQLKAALAGAGTSNNYNLTINEAGRRGNVRQDVAMLRAMASI